MFTFLISNNTARKQERGKWKCFFGFSGDALLRGRVNGFSAVVLLVVVVVGLFTAQDYNGP